MDKYIIDYKRRTKALLQNFKIIDIRLIYFDMICKIQNDKNKQYTIIISNYDIDYDIMVSCDCPDFTYTKKNCKHIYWLGFNKIGNMEPNYWTTYMLKTFFEEYLSPRNQDYIGRNDICPICIEEIDYTNEKTIHCVQTCNNAVHTKCWQKYFIVTSNSRCICCRDNTMPQWVAYSVYD